MFDKDIYVLDFETTGTLEGTSFPRITEIGIVNLRDETQTYQTYIDPEEELSEFIVKYTGITDELLSGKPKFRDIAKDLISFFGGNKSFIAAWPISFEMPILQYEFMKADFEKFPLNRRAIDIGTLACHHLYKNSIELLKDPDSKDSEGNPSLDNISYTLGIKQVGKRHSALEDAKEEAKVLGMVI